MWMWVGGEKKIMEELGRGNYNQNILYEKSIFKLKKNIEIGEVSKIMNLVQKLNMEKPIVCIKIKQKSMLNNKIF